MFGEKYQYCVHFLAWHLHLNDISRSPSFERQFVHLLYIMQNLTCHKNLNSSEWFEMDRFGEKTPFSGHGFWCVSLRNLSSHPPRCSIVPDGIRSKSHLKSSYHLINPSAFQKTKKKFQLPTENLLFFLTHGISGTQPYITLPETDASVSASNSAASRGLRRRRLEDTMDTAGVSGAESAPSIMR